MFNYFDLLCIYFIPRQVIVRAFGGGFSYEGRHFRRYVAKCEAAAKLLETLSQLPDQVPLSPLQHPLLPDDDMVNIPLINCPNMGSLCEHLDEENGSQDRGLNVQQKLVEIVSPERPPVSTSPVRYVASTGNQKSSMSLNPVGQLNELLAKERLNEPLYTFTCKTYGVHEEFTCTVAANDLSAKGIVNGVRKKRDCCFCVYCMHGPSVIVIGMCTVCNIVYHFCSGVGLYKKSAKHRAAANVLSLMESRGINIFPHLCPTVSS